MHLLAKRTTLSVDCSRENARAASRKAREIVKGEWHNHVRIWNSDGAGIGKRLLQMLRISSILFAFRSGCVAFILLPVVELRIPYFA
jgi:hypothetical protein